MEYEAVIGLEVHAQLATKTKIFCSCSTMFGAGANTQTCPVCIGMPGVLPVLNKNVVINVLKTGLALNSKVQARSVFARKNYFYPDLPKGYQISQYELPIFLGGYIDIESEGEKKKIRLTRIQMEEDAGKSIHGANLNDPASSYVDLNRTGVPLMEIVSEPEMNSSDEAKAYLSKLKTILQYLKVSDCNMEEGSLRCDANISIRSKGEKTLGVKTEVKNMNSFKNVGKALDYEIERQIKCVGRGVRIVQETRLWDTEKNITLSMRSKEEAHDYRYFPDPDLVPTVIDKAWIEEIKNSLPELPDAKKERFITKYSLPIYDAEVLTASKEYADFFEETFTYINSPKSISNWIMSEVLRIVNEKGCTIYKAGISPEQLADIIKLIKNGKISGKIGKQLFQEILGSDKKVEEIIKEKGLIQISDSSELEQIISDVIQKHPLEVERYRNGEKKLTGFLVGQVMKATKGKANPKMVNQLISKCLG